MHDRLPVHLEMSSECAGSTSSSGITHMRLRPSERVLCMLLLRGDMLLGGAGSFEPVQNLTWSRETAVLRPLAHALQPCVSKGCCPMQERAWRAVPAVLRQGVAAGCVSWLEETGAVQSCRPGRREARTQRALVHTFWHGRAGVVDASVSAVWPV